jgi:hypothetical protein
MIITQANLYFLSKTFFLKGKIEVNGLAVLI